MRCVYNVVLSSGHVVCINGLPFITLGHGSTDPVLAHAFFGTQVLLCTRACGAEQFHCLVRRLWCTPFGRGTQDEALLSSTVS
jgi:hypothetical protein